MTFSHGRNKKPNNFLDFISHALMDLSLLKYLDLLTEQNEAKILENIFLCEHLQGAPS